MSKFLVSIHRPHGFDHSKHITAQVIQAIDQVNDEMVAAGVRIFVAGLRSPSEAKSLHLNEIGEVHVTDGPVLDAKDFVDGFWVLECPSSDEAVAWGKKAALACGGSVEVRPIHGP